MVEFGAKITKQQVRCLKRKLHEIGKDKTIQEGPSFSELISNAFNVVMHLLKVKMILLPKNELSEERSLKISKCI